MEMIRALRRELGIVGAPFGALRGEAVLPYLSLTAGQHDL
jgi:hypothetical protein